MSGELRAGGSWHTLSRGEFYRAGVWRTLTRGEVYKGGAWRQFISFASSLSASAAPSTAFGIGSSGTPVTITSSTVTVTPSGGLGPYTYSWSGGGTNPTAPSNATTAFYGVVGPHDTLSATATCTVQDALGSAATASVDVELTNARFTDPNL